MHRLAFLTTTALGLLPIVGAPGFAQDLIDIPAQPLADALVELGNETGLHVSAASSVVEVVTSKAVKGQMMPQAALREMLSETGLNIRMPTQNGAVLSFSDVVSQNANKDEPFDLGTLVVRGELQERDIQDSQTSVTIVRGQELEQRGDQGILQLSERAPNVTQPDALGLFSIRGIAQNPIVGGSGPTISVQVDGAEIQNGNSLFPTWDVEQVEVLRGPQSTQQGRNALAGAVIIRTRDPEYVNEYRLRAGLDSKGSYQGALSFNQILVEGSAALRITGEYSRSDGYVDNTTLGINDGDRTDLDSFRAKLRINPTDNFDMILSYSYQNTFQGDGRIRNDLFPPDRIKETNLDEFGETKDEVYGLRLGYDFNPNLRLESETTFYQREGRNIIDLDRSSLDDGFSDSRSEVESIEQDLRLLIDGPGYSGVLGLFYFEEDLRIAGTGRTRGSLVPVPLPPGVFAVAETSNIRETENWAVFGEVELDADRFLPGLSFILGGRYDNERQKSRSRGNIFLEPGPTPPFPPFGESETATSTRYDVFIPKIGVIYEIREGLTTSFTYQEGYRAGGATVRLFGVEEGEFDPEFTQNYEFALRGEFMNGALITNANLFYTRWIDQQVVRFGDFGGIDTFIENAGESELFGGEFTIDYAATNALDLYAAIGYVETKYLDYITGNDNFTGNEFPGAPRWTGAIGGTYRFANGLTLGLDASFTDDAFAGPANNPLNKSDSRLLVNSQLTYERGDLLAGLYVRNLFDEDYAFSRSGSIARTGEPRTIGAYVEYRF